MIRDRSGGKRGKVLASTRAEVMNRDEGRCYYCQYEASAVDHVIPWSYGGSDDADNLVAVCTICNNVASNMVFDSLQDKTAFIRASYGSHLAKRTARERKKLCVCADCHVVYKVSDKRSTNVLCSDCVRLDDSVFAIRNAFDDGVTVSELADRYGVDEDSIRRKLVIRR